MLKSLPEWEPLKFNFYSSQKYMLQDDQDFMLQPLPQLDNEKHSLFPLSTWTEKDVNGTKPFPGADKFDNYLLQSTLQGVKYDAACGLLPDIEALTPTGNVTR